MSDGKVYKWVVGPFGDPDSGEGFYTLLEALQWIMSGIEQYTLEEIKSNIEKNTGDPTAINYRFTNYLDYRYAIKSLITNEIIWVEEEA